MNPRDRILAAIRDGLTTPRPEPEAIAAEAVALLADPDQARPRLAAPDLAEAFGIKATALGTTLERVARLADIPAAVGRYLAAHGLPPGLALQPTPALTDLDWNGVAVHQGIAPDEPAALGMALWGIAESGSLVIHSGPETPILLSFLPLHHIIVLHEADLLPHLEDYTARMTGQAAPRNAILITGPSGTTDIEGSYVRGAHGPGYLHVILVTRQG
ncbi:LutC/YkgG family protein [Paracoccus marinaquae]|uniref:LUD domain-containing protein n=1 Tax=Paracoccus marinaquae TaxID=2841926 RepID=A0ABS6AKF6_9RHOB|nr:LUD domain-containing protein [Paracoccus marinaquae]MBU3031064.1 LUD domain-containing protein [Paracoccus marinaquae]